MSPPLDDADGYASLTYESPVWMVRYAHRRRFEVAARIIAAEHPAVIMDWGAGDGYLSKLLLDRMRVISYDPDAAFHPLLRRSGSEVATSLDQIAETRVDAIACLEVMEHMSQRDRMAFYEYAQRALPKYGLCIVSVPVEMGPALLLKEAVRVLRKQRKLSWKMSAFLKASLGFVHRDPARFDPERDGRIQWHAGFDYRALREELSRFFWIEKEVATPLGGFPWLFNQTVIFALRTRN